MTRIRRIELLMVGLPLVRPFRTSFGVADRKECVLVRVETDAAEGWGECVADIEPDFSSEWNQSVWSAIEGFLGPAVLREQDVSAGSLPDLFAFVRGNPMAKATLVNAILDAELRERDESLASYLGADKKTVVCGVSVGITETVEELRAQSGLDQPVVRFLLDRPETKEFLEHTRSLLRFLLPRYLHEGKAYFTLALGCTGGRHRSVVLVEEIGRHLAADGHRVQMRHRDIAR